MAVVSLLRKVLGRKLKKIGALFLSEMYFGASWERLLPPGEDPEIYFGRGTLDLSRQDYEVRRRRERYVEGVTPSPAD